MLGRQKKVTNRHRRDKERNADKGGEREGESIGDRGEKEIERKGERGRAVETGERKR
jgi:hypothetical protein